MTTRYGSAAYGAWRNKHFWLLERSGQLRDDRRILLNGFEMDSMLEISGMTAIGLWRTWESAFWQRGGVQLMHLCSHPRVFEINEVCDFARATLLNDDCIVARAALVESYANQQPRFYVWNRLGNKQV